MSWIDDLVEIAGKRRVALVKLPEDIWDGIESSDRGFAFFSIALPQEQLQDVSASERILPVDQVLDPNTRNLRHIQDGETGAVVLESEPFAGPPDGDQVVEVLDVGAAGYRQTQKTDVAPLTGTGEHEDRRDRLPSGIAGVKALEEPPEQFVAEATRFMETAAGLLVVAEVNECPTLPIERIGPVRVIERCLQGDETEVFETASIPKATLVRNTKQSRKGVVGSASSPVALIDCIHDQRRPRRLCEWDYAPVHASLHVIRSRRLCAIRDLMGIVEIKA